MNTVTTFPSKEAVLSRWGRSDPSMQPVLPPQKWIDSYLSGFEFVADIDQGVDAEVDAWPNCAVFWCLMLDDAGRQMRVEEPWRGEEDGRLDAERLNEA